MQTEHHTSQDFEDGYVESEIQGHEGSVLRLSGTESGCGLWPWDWGYSDLLGTHLNHPKPLGVVSVGNLKIGNPIHMASYGFCGHNNMSFLVPPHFETNRSTACDHPHDVVPRPNQGMGSGC
jgi:hypothetical protein